MTGIDRLVLLGLQALVLGVPLLVGGMHARTLPLAVPLVLALLLATVMQRMRRGRHGSAPGVFALAAFTALALATTVPLPPGVLQAVAPATAAVYRETLPGWPQAGGWSVWRPLAWDAWGVWIEVLRFALGFGTFAVIVAYPWDDAPDGAPGRQGVVERLFVTLVGGALALALLGALEQLAGNGEVLWVSGTERTGSARLAGPFVNPNHFAAWLEILIPTVAAWAWVVCARVGGRLCDAVRSGRAVGVNARRAWASALLANQRRLWPPLAVALTVGVLAGTHAATDSRGGRVALLSGLAFVALGVVVRSGVAPLARLGRRAAPVLAATILLCSGATIAMLARASGDEGRAVTDARDVDVDFGSRLAVAATGVEVVREHALLGTGLGSWLHAFRPHQAPPIEDGIWDHAHNDYLELAAESGVVGMALAMLFVLAVARAARAPRRDAGDDTDSRRRDWTHAGGPAFERSDWTAALRDHTALRWGIAGGVLAVLVHSFVDFGLRMPGNLVLLMTLLGVLVLLGTPPARRTRLAPALLCAAIALAAAVPVVDVARLAAGERPLSPGAALAMADELAAETGDVAGAASLIRWAIELAPADRDAHAQLAATLGPGREGEAALRRALALEPWAAELRDDLALMLWEVGQRDAAVGELADGMFRWPHLETHAYLSPGSNIFPTTSAAELLREITDGETLQVRLELLEPEMAAAVESGLRRALDATPGGETRWLVTRDLIALLEARGRWAEAASLLRAEGELRADDSELLAHAARDYLRAGDIAATEAVLLRAITRTPEQGALYRTLAVEVYARRGDFATAETLLEAGGRAATDMVPVYRGITEVLARREATRDYAALPQLPAAGAALRADATP